MSPCHELTRKSAIDLLVRPGCADPFAGTMLRSTIVVLMAFFVVLSLAVAPAYSQSTISLQGRVISKSGVGQSFARLEFSGPGRYVVLTNGRGEYAIGKFATGRYEITVRQGGNYQVFDRQIAAGPLDLTVGW